MQYNLASELDRRRLETRLEALLARNAVVELTEKTQRTLSQNAYLHLLIGVVAMECGVKLEEAKDEYYKRLINRDLFVIEKDYPHIGRVETLRSSAELTVEEMSLSIDRLKNWGAENGIYLPNPEDRELLRDIEIEMGKYRQYL